MTDAARRWRGLLTLALLGLVLRVWDLGNPVIHVDEQWYLLVGDRMWHGAVPYLTIWDRKPIGLFLLFAAIRALPGDGILAYQLAALGCAVVTAWVVQAGARRIGAAPAGAWAAGALYLVGLSVLGGRGGQAPVFYNLPMAVAGVMTLALPGLGAHRRSGRIAARGVAVCLLAGIAIQMKYTPAVEGAGFALVHLWWLRRAGARLPALAGAALAMLIAGLAPTIAAAAWYAAHGALATFVFANFTSIGLRPGYPAGQLAMRLLGIATILSPSIAAAIATWRMRGTEGAGVALAAVWLAAAVLGFLAIGTFFDHYALPLLAPLSVMAGPAFGRAPRARAAALVLGLLMVMGVQIALPRGDRAGARALAAVVKANSTTGCPYVFIGDTVTYLLADACLPTAYAFPNLLAYTTERGATGIDEAREVRRILAGRPPVIVTTDRRLPIWNPASLHAVKAALAREYRPVFAVPRAGWHSVVYLRRDLSFHRR